MNPQHFPGRGHRLNEQAEGQPGLDIDPGAPGVPVPPNESIYLRRAREAKEESERKDREYKAFQARLAQASQNLVTAHAQLDAYLKKMKQTLNVDSKADTGPNRYPSTHDVYNVSRIITDGINKLSQNPVHKTEHVTLYYYDVLNTVHDVLRDPLNTETHTRLINLTQGLRRDGEVRNIPIERKHMRVGGASLEDWLRLLACLAITAAFVLACIYLPPLGAAAGVAVFFMGVFGQLPALIVGLLQAGVIVSAPTRYNLFSQIKNLHHEVSKKPQTAGQLSALSSELKEAKAENRPQGEEHINPPPAERGMLDILANALPRAGIPYVPPGFGAL